MWLFARVTVLPLALLAFPGASGQDARVWATTARLGPQTGTVEGTVQLTGVRREDAPMLSPYARRRYAPPARSASSAPSPEDVVVYLSPASPTPPAAGISAEILQEDRTITPRVTPIRVGTRVDFPNGDEVYHNLFSLSDPHPFNLGRYPPGDSRSETFSRPGVVRMFCDIHSEMVGVILVLDTPYFAKAEASGAYRIPDVPQGQYTAVAWHEAATPDSTEVTVPAAGAVQADFSLGR
jgi:plastocyanin